MEHLQRFLIKLNKNLNICKEREPKYGGTPPIELVNEIEEYEWAISLVKQTLIGEMNETDLLETLKNKCAFIPQKLIEQLSQPYTIEGSTSHLPYPQHTLTNDQLITSPRLIRPKISNYLHRPRLTDKLTNILTERSVFLHTDAGYGKTWLIHDFITATTPPFIWYSFNRDVITAIKFIEELASEVVRQTKHTELRTLTYLYERGKDARPDEALATLIEEMQSSDLQLLLVIENIQHVSDDSVNNIIELLLMSHPSNLRIILTSRLPLPFGQARLIAQGLLTVVGRSDISFNLEETREYLENNLKLILSQQQLEYLSERTAGWIAAVALAANTLQGTSQENIDLLFKRLTGFDGNIYNFFAEETYLALDSETQWLLKRLGFADTIQSGIVDLFTNGTNGGQILKNLANHNTFLIEDDRKDGNYYLHSLFSEFLQTRLEDEEGSETVQNTHGYLAHYYSENQEWYSATQHAIRAEEYNLAIQGLELIVPVGLNSGYSHAVLDMTGQIPEKWLDKSAPLQEFRGRAASQIGEPKLALNAFLKAQKLYQIEQDEAALNRLQFFIAQVNLSSGNISAEDFVRIAHKVTSNSYKQNEVLFGTQVELRLIEIGQTLTMRYKGLLRELIERSESLLDRIESLGGEFASVKARALVALAHLLFQSLSFMYQGEVSKIHIRSETGHPIPEEDRISSARIIIEGWQHIWDLYIEAENITKEESEIEWARICLQRIRDYSHHMSLSWLITAKMGNVQEASLIESWKIQTQEMIKGFLPVLEECAQIFGKYHMNYDLALAYCDAADTYDLLDDQKNRNRLAQEALNLAEKKGLTRITERAQKLLEDEFTFSSLSKSLDPSRKDEGLATLDEEGKAHFVDFFLRAYAGDVDIEEMRKAAEADVNDMVMVAKQRLDWCRHIEIIQDLQHAQSLDTMYRIIPKKRIVCMELGHRSPNEGHSFDQLWPMFKSVYCLTCTNRSLAD